MSPIMDANQRQQLDRLYSTLLLMACQTLIDIPMVDNVRIIAGMDLTVCVSEVVFRVFTDCWSH